MEKGEESNRERALRKLLTFDARESRLKTLLISPLQGLCTAFPRGGSRRRHLSRVE